MWRLTSTLTLCCDPRPGGVQLRDPRHCSAALDVAGAGAEGVRDRHHRRRHPREDHRVPGQCPQPG
eukprot:574081-Rhodomonas_salina.5